MQVETVNVKIVRLNPDVILPSYAHGSDEDAGFDIRAAETISILPHYAVAVPTGLAVEIPPGWEMQLRPRSGLALKNCVTIANTPGTIDPGFRGEIKVILMNFGIFRYEVQKGDRIAQGVLSRYGAAQWLEVNTLETSTRSTGGFGSSGR